jgi:hypothetical protein
MPPRGHQGGGGRINVDDEERTKNRTKSIYWMIENENGHFIKYWCIRDVERGAREVLQRTNKPVILLRSVGIFELPTPIINYRDLIP